MERESGQQWKVNMYEERENLNMREKIECIVPRLKMKKGGRKTKGRKEESDRQKKSKHRAREQGQHFLLLFFFFFLSISLSSNFFPFSSGLKSDIHHSRVPETIYLECRRHENR